LIFGRWGVFGALCSQNMLRSTELQLKIRWHRQKLCLLLLLCSSLSCAFADANANATAKSNKAIVAAPQVLIVYLSRTNNTKTVAEFIQQAVGAELVAIELQYYARLTGIKLSLYYVFSFNHLPCLALVLV
jgi:hypothetical protein